MIVSLLDLLCLFTTTFSRFAQTIDYTWTTVINNKFFTIVLQEKCRQNGYKQFIAWVFVFILQLALAIVDQLQHKPGLKNVRLNAFRDKYLTRIDLSNEQKDNYRTYDMQINSDISFVILADTVCGGTGSYYPSSAALRGTNG